MPTYFFHLVSGEMFERDEVGVAFDDVNAAYLEACTAALEISFDMLRQRRDPALHRFEITDAAGRLLIDLPFSEVLRPSRIPGPIPDVSPVYDLLQEKLRLGRELKAAIAEEIVRAQHLVEATRFNIQRSRKA